MSSEFVVQSRYNSDTRTPVRYILSHVRRHWIYAVLLIIGAFSNAALAAAVPAYIGQAYNELQKAHPAVEIFLQTITWSHPFLNQFGNPMRVILLMALAIVASQALRAVLQLMRNFSSETFAQRIERDVRDELYASLLGKSMTFHDMQPVGDIMARVTNDVREMNLMMNPGFNLIIGSGMFLLVPLFAAPMIHPQLLLVPLMFVLCHTIVQYRLVMAVHPIAEKGRSSFGRMNSRLAEALEGIQVVRGAAQEKQEATYFTRLADTVRDYAIYQGNIEARYVSFFLLGLASTLGFVHASLLYYAGEINGGQVVAFMGQIALFGFPTFTSLFSLSRAASGYASARRILAIINARTELDQNPQGYAGKVKGAITFEKVDFGYLDGKHILHDVSFEVYPGKTVAIVGQTGAGKTTITKLINRTYDAARGRVLVDGVDVRDWSLEALRSQISVIEQDIFLFSRTIAQNIAFGEDHATQEEIEAAAKKAQAHDFISSFPEGYETIVGQRGVTLSGGQRQRIAIARAFQSDPPILILDDSTSAIDSATEDEIQKAIWTAAKGRTTILITHRLSQIRWADHIIVLKQGRVVAQGKHEYLLQTSSAYRRIFARYDSPLSTREMKALKKTQNIQPDMAQGR